MCTIFRVVPGQRATTSRSLVALAGDRLLSYIVSRREVSRMEYTVTFFGGLTLVVLAAATILFGYVAEEEALGRWHADLEDWPFAEAGMPAPA
jgi:hypothetical protein